MTRPPEMPSRRPRRYSLESFDIDRMMALFRKAYDAKARSAIRYPDEKKAARGLFLIQQFRVAYRERGLEGWELLEKLRLKRDGCEVVFVPTSDELADAFSQLGVDEPAAMTPEELDARLTRSFIPNSAFALDDIFANIGLPSVEEAATVASPPGKPLSSIDKDIP